MCLVTSLLFVGPAASASPCPHYAQLKKVLADKPPLAGDRGFRTQGVAETCKLPKALHEALMGVGKPEPVAAAAAMRTLLRDKPLLTAALGANGIKAYAMAVRIGSNPKDKTKLFLEGVKIPKKLGSNKSLATLNAQDILLGLLVYHALGGKRYQHADRVARLVMGAGLTSSP